MAKKSSFHTNFTNEEIASVFERIDRFLVAQDSNVQGKLFMFTQIGRNGERYILYINKLANVLIGLAIILSVLTA
jgi:hypothetical protein